MKTFDNMIMNALETGDYKFTNLNNAIKDNELKVIIIEVPVRSIPPEDVDEYMHQVIDFFNADSILNDYEL